MRDRWYPPDFPARLEQLRDLGVAYRDIAATLSQEYSRALTRNAISGLVHRMKLPRLPQPSRSDHIRKRPSRARPKPPPEQQPLRPVLIVPPPPALPAQSTGTYSIFDLKSSSCRYPIGNQAPYLFCGETKADGSYCKEHAQLCCRGWT